MSYDYVQYLYNHVRCCQWRALHDFFRHVSTFLCQIRDLITDADHRARVLYSSACAARLGIGIMPIQAQSSHLFTELSDCHPCCKTLDYKYWMPTLVKEITVLQKMDWLSLIFCHWLSLITVFAALSCSPRSIPQLKGARTWFLRTLCAHLFSNDNFSCLGSHS